MEILEHNLENLDTELEAVACGPVTPSSIRRYFLLLVREHWADPANHGADLKDTFSCLSYPDSLDVRLSGEKGDSTREIIVGLGPMNFGKISFGDVSLVSDDNATEDRAVPASCAISFLHAAPGQDEALDMAWSTCSFLLGFKVPIMNTVGLENFQPKGLGPQENTDKKLSSRFVVDLAFELSFYCSVATTVESHRLKRVYASRTLRP